MIFNGIANGVLDLANWLLGLLPSEATNAALALPTSWLSQFGSYMNFIGNFVPLGTLGVVVTLIVTYQSVFLVIRLTIWAYHLIRP